MHTDDQYEPSCGPDHRPGEDRASGQADNSQADNSQADNSQADTSHGFDGRASNTSDLDAWARHMDRIIPPGRPAAWIRLWGDPGSGAWASEPLPEPDEVETLFDLCGLMGWVAPPTCVAMAVVADGTVQPEHPDGTVDEAPPGRVRVVCLVTRSGQVAARIHVDGGPPSLEPPAGGRLLDSMRRAFGLPTPPPTTPSTTLVERVWLGAVADAARDGMVALGWEQVRRLHPAVAVLDGHGLEMTDDLVDAALRLAPATWTWEWLRQQTAEGRWGVELVAPELADWMDEGMFSRWILDETRPSSELLAEVTSGVSATALRRLRGLLSRPDPGGSRAPGVSSGA